MNLEKMKKAISPLIATILLVVVAVVLVTIVLTWGKNFTNDSLSDTTGITDDSCLDAVGTLSLSECSVLTDGNLTLKLRNNSSSYAFDSSDVFSIELTDTAGGSQNYNIDNANIITPASWDGLSAGETEILKMKPGSIDTSSTPTVRIKSSVCPADAVAQIECN